MKVEEIEYELMQALQRACDAKELKEPPYGIRKPILVTSDEKDGGKYGQYWTSYPLMISVTTRKQVNVVANTLAKYISEPLKSYTDTSRLGFLLFKFESENEQC